MRIWQRGRWPGSSGRSSRAARRPGSPTGSSWSGSRPARRRDEAAFAAMVARHGPMVLGVCRQILDDHHLAEDAFQAVFLVLARKARSIRDPDLLGNWLYGVALRTARCARLRLVRRRQVEEAGTMTRPGSSHPVEPTAPPADEAVDGPRAGRDPARRDRAAARGLPPAGRALLPRGPHRPRGGASAPVAARHGPQPRSPGRGRSSAGRSRAAASCCPVPHWPRCSTPGPPRRRSHPSCATSTTRAAIHFAAGPAAGEVLSASTAALAREVLRSMLIHKLKLVALTVLFLGAVATGAGFLGPFAWR